MPFKSQAQRGLMYAAKSDPAVRKRTGIPLSVAEEFTEADKPGKLPMHTGLRQQSAMARALRRKAMGGA